MDNPRTTINVKSMRLDAWERAKAAASRADETMGEWLSRACDHLANREAGERYILPGNPANPIMPPAAPVVDFGSVAAVICAMHECGLPVQRRVGRQVNALLYQRLRDCRPVGISGGKASVENGKAGPENRQLLQA